VLREVLVLKGWIAPAWGMLARKWSLSVLAVTTANVRIRRAAMNALVMRGSWETASSVRTSMSVKVEPQNVMNMPIAWTRWEVTTALVQPDIQEMA